MVMMHVICGRHGGCERQCALTATTIPPQDGAALQILRTPDKSFADLPGYPFQPHYVDVASGVGGGPLRVHYIDEGPTDAPAVRDPPRGAIVVVSLPQKGSSAHRRRSARGGDRPGRLRPQRQAGRS